MQSLKIFFRTIKINSQALRSQPTQFVLFQTTQNVTWNSVECCWGMTVSEWVGGLRTSLPVSEPMVVSSVGSLNKKFWGYLYFWLYLAVFLWRKHSMLW